MNTSTRLCPLLALLALALGLSPASAQSPSERPELAPATARNLLAQKLEVIESEIDVAYTLSGEKMLKRGFSSRSAALVVYLATGLEDGHRRRRCEEQIFLWTPQYGWFLEEVVEEPFRDYLRIWSETKGYLEIK